jgi:uncharacterized Fe-S center protein
MEAKAEIEAMNRIDAKTEIQALHNPNLRMPNHMMMNRVPTLHGHLNQVSNNMNKHKRTGSESSISDG